MEESAEQVEHGLLVQQNLRLNAQNASLSHQLTIQTTRFEERYQNVIADFYHAQAAFHAAKQECQRLRQVLQVKQRVIELLLPYYPHPLTPELQTGLALA